MENEFELEFHLVGSESIIRQFGQRRLRLGIITYRMLDSVYTRLLLSEEPRERHAQLMLESGLTNVSASAHSINVLVRIADLVGAHRFGAARPIELRHNDRMARYVVGLVVQDVIHVCCLRCEM